jgi:hypothetical protein
VWLPLYSFVLRFWALAARGEKGEKLRRSDALLTQAKWLSHAIYLLSSAVVH